MKIAVIALASAALLAACSSARVQVNAGAASTGTPGAGTSVTSTRTGLHVQGGTSAIAAALVIMGLLAAGAQYSQEERPFPDPRALVPGNVEPPAPLAPQRAVSEQDCSKPVELAAGNLRCR